MKKQLFTKLLSTAVTGAIVLSYGMFVCADETEKTESDSKSFEIATVEENVVVDSGYDNDEMAEGYIRQKMSLGKDVTYAYDYAGQLDDGTLAAYNYLSPVICEIAAGTQTSTDITIPKESLCFTFTFDELGVTGFSDSNIREKVKEHMPVDQDALVDALLFSHPYELYWYDKSAGCSMGYGILGETSSAGSFIKVTNFHFKYSVASEYQDGDRFKVNSTFGTALTAAATSVRNIIRDSAGYDDYNKLLYYNDMICLMTDYNHDAVNNGAAYGNPWQLVWVFDGNDSTKVVCEGYSKAFQYLCDNTAFDSDSIYAICVYGSIPEGGHMWNIVHMEDGKNYLVDVTNSDPGGNGRTGQKYFLKGSSTGSVSSGFTVNGAKFQYYADVTNFYPESALTLAKSDYSYTAPAEYNITVINNVGGTGFVDPTRARAGQTINSMLILDEGYLLDGIKVNGEFIEGGSFKMPAKDTTVEFVFKKQDFTVTLLDVQNGTATLSATTAQMGDTVTVTAIPDTGYELDCIKVDGVAITGNSFEMPYYNVKVEVLFKQSDYRIWVFYAGGGKAYASANTAHYGDTITLTYDYPAGYEITRISVYDEKSNFYTVTNDSFTMPATEVFVEVEFDKINYNITFDTVENCNASVKKNTANAFEDVTVTVEPFEGYELDYITVNGNMINGCTFEMPLGDVTINVFCKKTDYRVKLDLLKNCDASLSASTANFGDEITVTVDPVEGYELDYIKVNGTVIDSYTFTMPANDVAVDVVCKKIDYTVKLNLVKNCDASLNTDTANVGDEITVTVDPVEGYELDYIKVNDQVIDGYTFVMPAKDVAVDVVCKKIDYRLKLDLIKNCDASLNSYTANVGDEITVTVEPVEGYELDYIKVNGTVIDGYTFTMPANDVAVDVVCKKIDYTVKLDIVKNCDASLNTDTANVGDEITVTVDPVEGYELDYIKVNGTVIDGYTFIMPAKDVVVDVVCKKIDYTITMNIIKDCEAAPNTTIANEGDEITINVEPVEGYEFDYLEVNGTKITSKVFVMPAENVIVNVYCKKIDYTITMGIIKDCDAETNVAGANAGDEITVTVTPVEGYEFDYIEVNGTKYTATTFQMPAANVTVNVYCRKIDYTVTVTAGNGGTAAASVNTANVGDEITITATPETGYEFDYISVNGVKFYAKKFQMPAANAEVEVVFKKIAYKLSFGELVNGTARFSKSPANMGDKITVKLVPDAYAEFDYIRVNGEKINGNTFTMPAGSVVVDVYFVKIQFPITVAETVNGTVELPETAGFDDVITVVTTPDTGYEVDTIKVNGSVLDGDTFVMDAGEMTVEVTFKKSVYNVTLASTNNGTATVSATTANYGDEITVTATPADGYTLDTVKVNGEAIDGLTFKMPAEDATVEVTFKKDTFAVTLTYDSNLVTVSGISATGSSKVGTKYEFTVTAADKYEIASVKVNGTEISAAGGKYTVTQPEEDIEIAIEATLVYVPKNGWITEGSNKYYYVDDKAATGWTKIEGSWYYFSTSGVMQTGWVKVGSSWYYLDTSGVMATGWEQISGKWYYLKSNGVMVTSWQQISGKWYYFENSGAMVTGWKQISSKWYYFENSGAMVSGWKQISGKWYYFESSGAMKTGWFKDGNSWYYLNSNGSMATGWLQLSGKWYYLESSGVMVTGSKKIGSKTYNFDSNGVCLNP
ncbi:InlB B-repeat-containing protein [Butyrivibrio sp. AE2032]|uniref:InlB B-repeat-containing protein n=1 Tax=Butyrivibrio sp. AE2032 TaxID=1458463 RepID=UPI0005537758|nr:MucBP domain-containing protein [Butyrivibrio sp. AE2032]